MAQSSLEKLAPMSGWTSTRQQSRRILHLYFGLLLTGKWSVVNTDVLGSQDCETKAADRCTALSFSYECSVLVSYGSCALSVTLFVG